MKARINSVLFTAVSCVLTERYLPSTQKKTSKYVQMNAKSEKS